jgi:hypothetical protein
MSLECRDHYYAVIMPEVKIGYVRDVDGRDYFKDKTQSPEFAVALATLMNQAFKAGFKSALNTAKTINLGEYHGGERPVHIKTD